MLYNIHINQLAFTQFSELDYRHSIIFDAIHKIFTTFNKIEKLDDWYWLSYDLILEQLPLLKIGKDQLRILIKDLAKYNLIDINPNNQRLGKTYFKFGKNAEMIFRPLEKIQDPSGENSRPPLEKIQDNNIQKIITKKNSYSKNSKIEEIKANPIFDLNKKSKFQDLTEDEIDLTLQTALVDNPKLSFASAINWLANENKNKTKTKSKEQIYKENTETIHYVDKYQDEDETIDEFEARVKELEAITGSKYRLHYKGDKNPEFFKLKANLLKNKIPDYD